MVEELLKNPRVARGGRRILSSVQKASIVDIGNLPAYLAPNLVGAGSTPT